jgi:hypothetical protein
MRKTTLQEEEVYKHLTSFPHYPIKFLPRYFFPFDKRSFKKRSCALKQASIKLNHRYLRKHFSSHNIHYKKSASRWQIDKTKPSWFDEHSTKTRQVGWTNSSFLTTNFASDANINTIHRKTAVLLNEISMT